METSLKTSLEQIIQLVGEQAVRLYVAQKEIDRLTVALQEHHVNGGSHEGEHAGEDRRGSERPV